jgi:hypothetical protein
MACTIASGANRSLTVIFLRLPLAKERLLPEMPYGLMPYAQNPYEVPELWKSNPWYATIPSKQ